MKLLSRRQFLNLLLGSSAFAWVMSIIYPITRYLFPPAEKTPPVLKAIVAKVFDFPPNTGKIVKLGQKPILLFCREDGQFKAFTAKCTHLDCLVQYRAENQTIWCACHNGVFDLDGKNISGPPPKPLEEYAVQIQGDDVVIAQKV